MEMFTGRSEKKYSVSKMIVRAAALGCYLLGVGGLAPAAAADPADALFARGVGAFKSGDFSTAVDYFRQARDAGLDTPALHYDLGVSFYKLGRYTDAEEAFRACADDPGWASLARYNMGLSAYQRGERTRAKEYFEDAWRTADNENIRALASIMLERLGVPSRRSFGVLTADIGYNNNVTLTADNQTLQTTREADSFVEVLAAATGRWGAGSAAPRWDASLYNVSYRDLTDNNITELLLGASQPGTAAGWHVDAGGLGQYVLRDGHRFQQIASLRLEGTREMSDDREVRVGVMISAIHALDGNFEFLAGSRRQLEASLGWPLGGGRVRAGVTLERNDRKDLTTATEFFSYSPTRYALRLAGVWPFGSSWRIEPAVRYYHSRYADPDRRASGLVATREDEQFEVSLRAKRRLSLNWQLLGEYTYVHNVSNLAEFSYAQRVMLIGVTRPF